MERIEVLIKDYSALHTKGFRNRGSLFLEAVREAGGLPINDQIQFVKSCGGLIDQVLTDFQSGHQIQEWAELINRALMLPVGEDTSRRLKQTYLEAFTGYAEQKRLNYMSALWLEANSTPDLRTEVEYILRSRSLSLGIALPDKSVATDAFMANTPMIGLREKGGQLTVCWGCSENGSPEDLIGYFRGYGSPAGVNRVGELVAAFEGGKSHRAPPAFIIQSRTGSDPRAIIS